MLNRCCNNYVRLWSTNQTSIEREASAELVTVYNVDAPSFWVSIKGDALNHSKVRSEHNNKMNIVKNHSICHDNHERAKIRDRLQRKEAITAGR